MRTVRACARGAHLHEGVFVIKNKHTIVRCVGCFLLALLFSAAVSLPNYAKVAQLDRLQAGGIADLYNDYLADFGAQEAHAILPALALPAALAAAGVTSEMAAAAIAAIVTAVAATSLHDVWDKMPPSEKMGWTSETEWALTTGWLASGMTFDPKDPEQPPEPTGSSGNALIAAILALTTGAGVVGVRDLADCAADFIKFAINPASVDADGLSTGLGTISLTAATSYKDVVLPLVSAYDYSVVNGISLPALPGYVPVYSIRYYSPTSFTVCYFRQDSILFPISANSSSTSLQTQVSTTLSAYWVYDDGRLPKLVVDKKSLEPGQYHTNGGAITYFDSSVWLNRTSVQEILNQVQNAPTNTSTMYDDIAKAGVGTPAADQIINNYVTNNIANSDKVVNMPSDIAGANDYDKVVTDPGTTPDPGPDPDPDNPGKDPNVTVKDFLDLPIQLLFPFCLVYDIQLLIEHVAGGAVAMDDSLVFEFDLGFGYFDAPLVIDLTEYQDMQGAFHMAFNVMLVVGLLYFSISLFLKARSD